MSREANLITIRHILHEDLNGRRLKRMGDLADTFFIDLYSTKVGVITLHIYFDGGGELQGFDVFTPLDDSNNVQATIDALKALGN